MKRLLILVLAMMAMAGISCVSSNSPIIELRDFYCQWLTEQMVWPTVRITTSTGCGSGVIIHHKNTEGTKNAIYILTASHVIRDESVVTVEIFYPVPAELEASVLITDTGKDLALLRALSVSVAKTKLAPRDYQYSLFTPVYTVGCSLGLPPRPSSGIISSINSVSSVVEISSPILPGNSGGPVYDALTCEVIGIAVSVYVYDNQLVTTMARIVPIQTIYEFLDNHSKYADLADITDESD